MSDTTIRMDPDDLPSSGVRIDHGRFVPGALVGSRYRIVAMLGKGGMGEVYRADDLLLGQPVALKFLPRRVAGDPHALSRLLGEVRIARQISHPNVCRVYDVGEVDGEHFISMEYVQGEDLKSLLQRIGRFGPDKGAEIARQICAGLAAAHDRGVLHRDLKPANVMIDERGTARITDFGLAVLADSAEAQRREGTPAYMAPEQLEGEEVTTRSDIYSLGLVLYEVFTGHMLFDATTIHALLEMRRSTTAKSVRLTNDVDPIVERVIQRCLADDPAQRPRTASAVAAALPGGDPLDAALAAGETPSPEMVAAAGEHRGVEPLHAIGGLAAVVVLLALVLFCKARVDMVSRAGIREPPAVMAVHARDLMARLGYTEKPRDQAWRYAPTRRESIDYWYRESPAALVPSSFIRQNAQATTPGFLSDAQPPPAVPGEAVLKFGTDGRLHSLLVVPPKYSGGAAKPADWNPLLDAAQLDRASLKPTAPAAASVPFDARAAWTWNDRAGTWIAEAASFGGRVVWFEIRNAKDPVTAPPSRSRSLLILWLSLFIALIIFLARRNIALGRADMRGAGRIAIFGAVVCTLTFILGADHVSTQAEALVVLASLSWTAFISMVLFGGYIAVEPTMRRRWPRSLVSWTRLLDGQFKDPIVGRDVLAGCVGGLLIVLGEIGFPLILAVIRGNAPPPLFEPNATTLNGGTLVLAELISGWGRAIVDAMSFVIFLVMFWRIVRNRWAAALLLFLLQASAQVFTASDKPAFLFSVGVFVACTAFLPARFGFLSLVVACGIEAMMAVTPLLLPPAAWHTGITAIGVAAVLAIAGYGFVTALGGRPLFTEA